jgi:flagellar hook-length control protein FliK
VTSSPQAPTPTAIDSTNPTDGAKLTTALAQALGPLDSGAANTPGGPGTDAATAKAIAAANAAATPAGTVTTDSRDAQIASRLAATAQAAGAASRVLDAKSTSAAAASAAHSRSGADQPNGVNASAPSFAAGMSQASGPVAASNAAELAVIEGSDATGAAATAQQSLSAASATTAPTNPQQGALLPGLSGLSGPAAPAAPALPASPAVAGAATLAAAGDDGKHSQNGSGDAALGGNAGDGAAAAQQLLSGQSTTASMDASSTPTFRVSAGLDTAEFPQGLAERVSFMVDSNLNGAKLQVNPPQLGPIELQIAVQGNHAQVSMTTHSAVTREALESSVPKLREMLGAQGFGQVSVDISQRSFQERPPFAQPYERASAGTPSSTPVAASATARTRAAQGALDAYA